MPGIGKVGLLPPIEPAGGGPPTPDQAADLAAVQAFAREVLRQNLGNMHVVVRGTRMTFTAVFVMYLALFGVGIGAAVAAIVRSFIDPSVSTAVMSLGFAGMTAASFFTIFLLRPLDSMGREGIFLSWLVAVTNSYWTRLMYFQDPANMDADLRQATDDLVAELSELADKYAAAVTNTAPIKSAPKTNVSAK